MAGAKNVDDKAMRDRKPGEKSPGKQHYNPVNMSGREAGIVEEIEEDKAQKHEAEKQEDGRPKPRKQEPGAKP